MKKTITFSLVMLLSILCAVTHGKEALEVTGPESAAKLTFQSLDESQILVSVLDAQEKPIRGLQPNDFTIIKNGRSGKILSVKPLETSEEVPLNVVLVVDNSYSMEQRKAIQPMLDALDKFFDILRPIDVVHAVVFDDNETIALSGKNLNVRTLKAKNVDELRSFFHESFQKKTTNGTYLYESMLMGLDILRKMPEGSNKFLLVFTDGQDINSTVRTSEVREMSDSIPNFSAYALDFTEVETVDAFLMSFSEAHGGKTWKAASSDELIPRFQSFANTLLYQYVVSYRFLSPPEATLALEPDTIIIEEVTTIDSSPLLNYVFFEAGQYEIPNQYVLFSNQSEREDFSESKLGNPMEKYRNILNIIGKRLSEHPDARITIVGCNSNQGQERGNIGLSQGRAEAVRTYLQQTWGVDPSRMEVKARNLPQAPSARSTPEGIAENQRVEIRSDDREILDIVRSTYVQEMADPKALRILPQVQAEAGIANWKVELKGEDETVIESASGEGDMTSAVTFNLVPAGLSKIASFKTLTASVEVTDKEGEAFRSETAATTNVKFIRKEEMRAERKGYRVLEQYALILFEFDSAKIEEHNKAIIDRIVARMKELPSADIKVVGHTDIIGTEEYNIELSKRRARAVFDQLVAAGVSKDRNLTYTGVGPHDPLYNNADPEGRALNRTVTITLDYEEKG